MLKALLFLSLFLLTLCSLSIDPHTLHITDQSGRSLFFHGVNVVNKIFPFYPNTETFNTNDSLCQQDLKNLRGWGMNIIRLHVAWEGVQPTRDFINETYIMKLRDIVRMCAKYNISVLLDAHQDLFSKKFCGEGFPDWTVNRTTFPWPLPYKIRFDEKGYPLRQDCQKVNFAEFYLTRDVNKFQEEFLTNQRGLSDQFAKMWQEVARVMRYEPNLVGYEVINEPFGANAYKNPVHFLVANNKYLLPFYKKVYAKLRQVDKNNLFFFEPSIIDIFGLGFLGTPGGKQDLSKQVFSYHLYCPLVTPLGQPKNDKVCSVFDDLTLSSKLQNSKYMKIAGMLTEFGALSDSLKSADQLYRITRGVQSRFHSWIYWQFKYNNDVTTQANPPSTQSFYYDNGTLQLNKVKALSHPYAYAVCGKLISTTFTTSSFRLVYHPGYCKGETEIYINEPYYFPDGFDVKFEPECEECHLSYVEKSYYRVVVGERMRYSKVTVDVIGHL